MFTFNDLMKIESRQMQLVLKELDTEDLILALKKASDEVKELIFSSMSLNAADALRENLENLGLKKRRDVETAQLKIAQQVRKLVEEGKIVLMDSDTI